jgi:hypothetical protein
MNTDELFAQMEEDERADRLEEQTLATPIDYARTRGIRPQQVYYHLRQGHLNWHTCSCGRRVISIQEADKLLGVK